RQADRSRASAVVARIAAVNDPNGRSPDGTDVRGPLLTTADPAPTASCGAPCPALARGPVDLQAPARGGTVPRCRRGDERGCLPGPRDRDGGRRDAREDEHRELDHHADEVDVD